MEVITISTLSHPSAWIEAGRWRHAFVSPVLTGKKIRTLCSQEAIIGHAGLGIAPEYLNCDATWRDIADIQWTVSVTEQTRQP